MLSHLQCHRYKGLKEEWEAALEKGSQRKCPSCNIGGIKDDAWTHMTWDNCSTEWCYFCGKPESELDKSDPNGPFSGHNKDWEKNPNRWPLLLCSIGLVDKRWSIDEDQEAKDFFHKILTYQEIRDFILSIIIINSSKINYEIFKS